MNISLFDQSFDGLLTAVFDAYLRRVFPDRVLPEGTPLPLFCDDVHRVVTDEAKAGRVWKGLQKRLSPSALSCLAQTWLAEEEDTPTLLFRYIRKAVDAPRSIETNFADPDVLALTQNFAAVEPEKNALPLTVGHFKDRFADQRWIIYDLRRGYGYYYDLQKVREITFDQDGRQTGALVSGRLDDQQMATDERLFQQLWKTYFKAISIRERLNPRKQRNDMPVRYWKHLTEKQD